MTSQNLGHYLFKTKTAKLLIEKIKNNFNQRYEFRNKQYALENMMFENIRELRRYITGNSKSLEFTIPDIEIKKTIIPRSEIRSCQLILKKRKELKINKSILWYQ